MKSKCRKKTREGSGRRTILVRDARMDIAAKLSGKYTLANVFKQLFHQARVAAPATSVIGRPHPIRAPLGRHPTSRHHRLKRAGYTMFRVGRFRSYSLLRNFLFLTGICRSLGSTRAACSFCGIGTVKNSKNRLVASGPTSALSLELETI